MFSQVAMSLSAFMSSLGHLLISLPWGLWYSHLFLDRFTSLYRNWMSHIEEFVDFAVQELSLVESIHFCQCSSQLFPMSLFDSKSISLVFIPPADDVLEGINEECQGGVEGSKQKAWHRLWVVFETKSCEQLIVPKERAEAIGQECHEHPIHQHNLTSMFVHYVAEFVCHDSLDLVHFHLLQNIGRDYNSVRWSKSLNSSIQIRGVHIFLHVYLIVFDLEGFC